MEGRARIRVSVSLPKKSNPRKVSRRIIVGNRDYRYMVTGNDGWIDLIVEALPSPGQKCHASFEYEDGSMTPSIVRQVIELALSDGCNPDVFPWPAPEKYGLKYTSLVLTREATAGSPH